MKIIRDNYLFLILFIIILLKDPIYRLFTIEEDIYTPIKCNSLEQDYNKLLEFNEIDLIYQNEYLNSYIIYKDIYNYLNEITIRGGRDNNLNGNPVVYDNTLIGFIDKVDKTTSTVKLITNKDSKVSVKINDKIGILEFKQGELIVSNISNYSDIKKGDKIFTSGLGKISENIYIGEVLDVELTNKNIEKKIKVDYRINIKDIDYVTILKENI